MVRSPCTLKAVRAILGGGGIIGQAAETVSLNIYTFVSSLPDRESWQAAIDEVGVDLKLDPDLDLTRDEGFSPCVIQGKASGFELDVTPASEVLADHPSLKPAAGDRSHALCFRWGGDLAECACVLGANLGLVRGFGAVACYPADEIVYDADKLEKELAECLAEA